MRTFRRLPPEVLETLGLAPEGDEDEPDEPSGPYELPHRIGEFSAPTGWPVPAVTSQADRRRGQRRRASHKSGSARPAPATIRRVARSLLRPVLALEDTGSTDLGNATSGRPYEAKSWIEVPGPEPGSREQQRVEQVRPGLAIEPQFLGRAHLDHARARRVTRRFAVGEVERMRERTDHLREDNRAGHA